MAPGQSLNGGTASQEPAWDTALAPLMAQRSKNPRQQPRGEGVTASPDPESTPSPPALKFLTTTGPPSERSREARLVVRSHAMQAFLRQKRSEGKPAPEKEPDAQVMGLNEAMGRFKLASWSRKSRRKTLSAVEYEAAAKQSKSNASAKASGRQPKALGPVPSMHFVLSHLDPFGVIPIALTPRTQGLLLHYSTAFTMNSVAVNPEGSWLSFALTDAALLHVTLSLVAYHYDITHGRDESLDCLYHKGEAIKKMNHRLSYSHQQFSDTSIATISLFANIETMNGTRPISDIHMNALERMITARGGLDKLGHNKVLQRVLTWTDIIYSSTWNCPPRFPLLESYRNEDPLGSLERFSSVYRPHPSEYDSRSWRPPNANMRGALETIRRISTAVASPALTRAERAAVSNRIYVLEHALLSSCDTAQIYTPQSATGIDLSEPVRIATLLYTHIILRELPHTAKMHRRLVSGLKLVLEEQSAAPAHATPRRALELLVWISFVGGAAAADAGERGYFVTLLERVSRGLKLEGREDLKGTLQGVVWLESVCEGYFSKLWKEMTMLQQRYFWPGVSVGSQESVYFPRR